jgi:hypothetical protein
MMSKKGKWSEETKARVKAKWAAKWADPEWRATAGAKIIDNLRRGTQSSEHRSALLSTSMKERWSDPTWRENTSKCQSQGTSAAWADPVKKAARLEKLRATLAKKKATNEA